MLKYALQLGLALVVVCACAGAAAQRAPALTEAQIREKIVQESVSAYMATGRPCACPYNLMRNGAACGGRSAYSKPGGAAPLCYPKDVGDGMIADWKRKHE